MVLVQDLGVENVRREKLVWEEKQKNLKLVRKINVLSKSGESGQNAQCHVELMVLEQEQENVEKG